MASAVVTAANSHHLIATTVGPRSSRRGPTILFTHYAIVKRLTKYVGKRSLDRRKSDTDGVGVGWYADLRVGCVSYLT